MNKEQIEQKYQRLFGHVPNNIDNRLTLAKKAERIESIAAIEAWREQLIYRTNSTLAIQQLIHFALLIGSKDWSPAKLHAIAALKVGVSFADLWTVCETGASQFCIRSAGILPPSETLALHKLLTSTKLGCTHVKLLPLLVECQCSLKL